MSTDHTRRTARRTLLTAAVIGLLAVPTLAIANHFTDVDPNSVHAPGINYLEGTGITAGCTATEYCPGDNLTRAQMGTFLHRASGNAPGIDPSVNAARLAGADETAYTTTVFEATTSTGSLEANTSVATAQQTAVVSDLPVGTYTVTGQVYAQSSGTDSSRFICRTNVDGSLIGRSIGRVGNDPGQTSQLSMPITATVSVLDGATIDVRCHAENVVGNAPLTSSNNHLTKVLVTRVGPPS